MTAVMQHIQQCHSFGAYNKNMGFDSAKLKFVPKQTVD